MAVLPPLEKRILQSRESDADAEMSSSSLSEEDALEYNMSEDLEDSPAVISPPPPSKPEKANKYKNRYTYGEPVKATLNLNTSLEMYSYESSYSRTPVLQDSIQLDGCYNYTVQVSTIDPHGNHRYKRVMVKANVVEDGTGVQMNKTEYLSRSYSPLKLDFNTGENQGEFYKPGLPYNGKLKVTNPDDTPAFGEPIEICATVSRKRVIENWLSTRKTKYCSNYTSDENGYIKFTIVPQNVDSVSIDLDAKSLQYTRDNSDLDQPTDFANLSPFYSPSGSFLQLETISKPLSCESQRNVRVLFTSKENSEFKLHYQ
ncbi:hypothetical protein AVEN_60169-1, partial [Araneus ventricosus]